MTMNVIYQKDHSNYKKDEGSMDHEKEAQSINKVFKI